MLTLSQRKTDVFIRQFFKDNGYAPTASEIAQGIGIKSRGVVYRYLKALESAGRIVLTPQRHRNIRLLIDPLGELPEILPSLPLLGKIAAGQPIETIPQEDRLDVAGVFIGPNRYALQVKGDSMMDEGIFDGDVMICEQRDSVDNGQIVIALLDQEAVTLKRFKRNLDNTVTLSPTNVNLSPMVYASERVTIHGIYIGLIRY